MFDNHLRSLEVIAIPWPIQVSDPSTSGSQEVRSGRDAPAGFAVGASMLRDVHWFRQILS